MEITKITGAVTEGMETAETVESAEAVETAEAMETVESAEATGTTEAIETVEPAEAVELVETTETAEIKKARVSLSALGRKLWVSANREWFSSASMMVLLCLILNPAAVMFGWIYYYLLKTYSRFYYSQGQIYHSDLMVSCRLYWVVGGVALALAVFGLIRFSKERASLREHFSKEPWDLAVIAFLGWSTVSTVLSANFSNSFWGSAYQYDGLISYYIFAAIYYLGKHTREADRLFLLRLFSIVANLCIMVMAAQRTGVPFFGKTFMPLDWNDLISRASVFPNLNHFGYYLCMDCLCCAGLFLYDRGRKRGIWYLVCFMTAVFALLVNDTFGAILAVLAALPVAVLFYGRSGRRLSLRSFLPLLLFFLICGVYLYSPQITDIGWREHNALVSSGDNTGSGGIAAENGETDREVLTKQEAVSPKRSTLMNDLLETGSGITAILSHSDSAEYAGTGRFGLWMVTLRTIPTHLFFGFGPNETPSHIYATDDGWKRPHNEYLQIALYTGIPGLIFYLAGLIVLAVRKWKEIHSLSEASLIASGSAVGYLISAFFGVPMCQTMPYLFLFLGMIAVPPDEEIITEDGAAEDGQTESNEQTTPDEQTAPDGETASDENRMSGDQLPSPAGRNRILTVILGAVCVVMMIVILYAGSRFVESLRESADLRVMTEALELMNRKDWDAEIAQMDHESNFWYDAEHDKLIPFEEGLDAPKAYGQGTAIQTVSFSKDVLTGIDYSGSQDYEDQILYVTVDPAKEEKPVKLRWGNRRVLLSKQAQMAEQAQHESEPATSESTTD